MLLYVLGAPQKSRGNSLARSVWKLEFKMETQPTSQSTNHGFRQKNDFHYTIGFV